MVSNPEVESSTWDVAKEREQNRPALHGRCNLRPSGPEIELQRAGVHLPSWISAINATKCPLSLISLKKAYSCQGDRCCIQIQGPRADEQSFPE
jgi:hypothetical protein